MASYLRGTALSPEQVAQVFYQAGWRGDDLAHIVGISTQREAGNERTNYHAYAGAHRTDTNQYGAASGDLGLAQINWGAWGEQLVAAGIVRTHTDLFDPLTNAKAAKYVLDKQGWSAWGAGPEGWKSGGDAWHGVNRGLATAAVQRASSQGLIGSDYQQGGNTAGATTGKLPSDARLVDVNGYRYAMFQIMPGLWIRYRNAGTMSGGRSFTRMSTDQWAKTFGQSVDGGDAAELADIPTAFGTYTQYLNAILDQVFTEGDPRRNDPEVMRVLASRAGRPDMTEAEFENLLKATNYYQSRTEGQLRWNDLSEAERSAQRKDVEARMRQTFLTHMGRDVSASELSQPGWKSVVDDVASGKTTFNAWVENSVKVWASQEPESPWSRQLRDERESQRQRPIEIENTALRVRETLARWGLTWSEGTIQKWSRELTEKVKSDDDLLNTIKQSTQTLFPWKDPEVETVVAAAPWIETYNRVLERQGSLQTAEIARALAAYGRDPENNDPWSFEQKLKMTDQYDQTRQGQDDAWSTVGELAGMMGF